jgi:hypothetical protein
MGAAFLVELRGHQIVDVGPMAITAAVSDVGGATRIFCCKPDEATPPVVVHGAVERDAVSDGSPLRSRDTFERPNTLTDRERSGSSGCRMR